MPAVYHFEKGFEAHIPERSEWANNEPPKEGDIVIYTDGSKTDEGTGAGIYCEELNYNISIPLGMMTTVFQSEVVAILEGSSELLQRRVEGKSILICTDSESSIKALSSYKISSKIVHQCHETLETLSENNAVSLIWVPGHSGIYGN